MWSILVSQSSKFTILGWGWTPSKLHQYLKPMLLNGLVVLGVLVQAKHSTSTQKWPSRTISTFKPSRRFSEQTSPTLFCFSSLLASKTCWTLTLWTHRHRIPSPPPCLIYGLLERSTTLATSRPWDGR